MLQFKIAVVLFTALTAVSMSQEIIAADAQLEKLADGFEFTEGPAADSQGNVYFTDQPNDRILVWTIKDSLETFMQPCGRSNGLYFDAAGQLWACADENNQLWRISMDKKITIVLKDMEGKLFNGPNDLWITPNGGVYFTDPYYRRAYWNRDQQPLPIKGVYYLAAAGSPTSASSKTCFNPTGSSARRTGKCCTSRILMTVKPGPIKSGRTAGCARKNCFAKWDRTA